MNMIDNNWLVFETIFDSAFKLNKHLIYIDYLAVSFNTKSITITITINPKQPYHPRS